MNFYYWSLLILGLGLVEIPDGIRGDQHVLLDTTKESMLDWTRYPYGPEAPTPGWVEESFTNFEKGINWRTYVVCDISYANVNNWLWTPFITRQGANRIYIETKFTVRNCDLFPGEALQCKETFSLLYYEFDAATRQPPPWEPESYKLIDRIAADEGRITENSEVIINTETRSIDVRKKGVYFAIRDQGACISLLAVKIYYLTCPEITVDFAHYPETPTGAEETTIEKIAGSCVENAVPVDTPFNLCQGDGSWKYNSGRCVCMAGYSANNSSQSCEECSVGTFKHTSGHGPCSICPPYSQSLYTGSVECRCNEGYHRAPSDPRDSACTKPPSPPRNIKYKFLDRSSSTVQLSWDVPRDDGSRSDLVYNVKCSDCPSGITFAPKANQLTDNRVVISGLDPDETYKFVVSAHNGVSKFANLKESQTSSYINVKTSSNQQESHSTSNSINLRIINNDGAKVGIQWDGNAAEDEAYEVKYFIKGAKKNSSKKFLTKNDEAEITDLKDGVDYGFQVRVKTTSSGWKSYSRPIYKLSKGGNGSFKDSDSDGNGVFVGDSSEEQEGDMSVTVGAIVSVIATVLIIIILLVVIRRNRNPDLKKAITDLDEDYRGLDYPTQSEHGIIHTHKLPQQYGTGQHKTYVDPHTYEDPNAAVRQFAKEIDSGYITIEAIIGGGEFGDVCRGRLSMPDRNDMMVAIKTLKQGSGDKARSDFLTEASIMGQFEHPNVIFLQGVVTKTNPIMIITEFMENGSLDTFLRANDGKFQVMQLVGMMRGIAYGMQYLSEMNYVHRDLAARNVLVNSQLVCKIADFGLSREITPDIGGLGSNEAGAYTTRGGKIPVRWTAPEAIAFRKFTSSSDVWSFGIVMWEVMSYGERPYWTWSNQDVIKAIEKGYRLPAPMDCPEALHQLMLDTWQKERSHRPSFISIVKTLDKLICCPETLRKIANSPFHNPFAPNVPDYSTFNGIDEWLASIKMTRYADNFKANGINTMDDVPKINLSRLMEMGITLVGHQKKIMGSIHAMRAQTHILTEGRHSMVYV